MPIASGQHNRLGTRTILFAVGGFGAAALVTSAAALDLGAGRAVSTAFAGGTVVLGVSTIITILCASFLKDRRRMAAWLTASAALTLLTGGAAVRGFQQLVEVHPVFNSLGDAIYAAGLVVLIGVLCAVPLLARTRTDLVWSAIESFIAAVLLGAGLWAFLDYGPEPLGRATVGFAGAALFLLVVVGAAFFTLFYSLRARKDVPTASWMFLAAGALFIVTSDLTWLLAVQRGTWEPGSLSDFVHLTGFVLVCVGASAALDSDRWMRPLDKSHEGEA